MSQESSTVDARLSRWPHQQLAFDAAIKLLAINDRAQLHMACGSGKTRVGLDVASHIGPRLLVWLSPTIELLFQSARASSGVLPAHARLFVGYAPKGTEVEGVIFSNDPEVLGPMLNRPSICFSTYASFPYLEEAARQAGVEFDLIVGDEAHKSAGEQSKLFARWLDDQVPAKKRLSMTATPRIAIGADGEPLNGSMDNEAVFGPVAYRYPFHQAVSDGVICEVEALLPVVEGDTGLKAQALALVAAQEEYDLHRIVSFHGTVAEAKEFARDLRELGVNALHVNGKHSRSTFEKVRRELAGDKPVVVTNARVFGEGIDVPALDAVFFSTFKRSVVDVTQQIGRAVRKSAGKAKGFIMLPPSQVAEIESLTNRGRYRDLWRAISSVLDTTESPDVFHIGAGQLKVTAVGVKARKVQTTVDAQVANLLYLRRLPITEHAWMLRASAVLGYLLEGNAPYAENSPHKTWISDNSIASRNGQLSPAQARKFAEIVELLEAPKADKLLRATDYVQRLEQGIPPDHALTCLVRNNRRQKGWNQLYVRMLAVRKDKAAQRRSRIVAFLEAYEDGMISNRSIYAQLVAGIEDKELSDRFGRLHKTRLQKVRAEREARQTDAVRRFRSGESAEDLAQELGVSKTTIWYWERQRR